PPRSRTNVTERRLRSSENSSVPGRVAGKTMLITGVARGQGRAAALLFSREGAAVIGCDVLDCQETIDLVRAEGYSLTASWPVDLGDREQARRWVNDAATELGGIDILYNNASAPRFASIAEMSLEDWHATIRNELDLVFHVSQAAWPHLV